MVAKNYFNTVKVFSVGTPATHYDNVYRQPPSPIMYRIRFPQKAAATLSGKPGVSAG